MNKNEPRLPIVGEFVRHHGTLIAIEEVPPKPQPPPKIDYIFEEIEARCEMRHKGEVIKEIQTLWDFYGLETSVKSAIEYMFYTWLSSPCRKQRSQNIAWAQRLSRSFGRRARVWKNGRKVLCVGLETV